MRYISALAVAALAFVLAGTGTPAAAQAPRGSYEQTCRHIGVRGSTLYAECQNTGGGWQTTQLRDFDRCNGEIQNINGSLQCSGGNGYGNNGYGRDADRDRDRDRDHDGDHDRDRGYRNNGLPYGSYSQTCQNIRVNGNTLEASCQKKNGKLKNTSLHNFSQCRDIENDNGKLRCR
jgi:CVNH domain